MTGFASYLSETFQLERLIVQTVFNTANLDCYNTITDFFGDKIKNTSCRVRTLVVKMQKNYDKALCCRRRRVCRCCCSSLFWLHNHGNTHQCDQRRTITNRGATLGVTHTCNWCKAPGLQKLEGQRCRCDLNFWTAPNKLLMERHHGRTSGNHTSNTLYLPKTLALWTAFRRRTRILRFLFFRADLPCRCDSNTKWDSSGIGHT